MSSPEEAFLSPVSTLNRDEFFTRFAKIFPLWSDAILSRIWELHAKDNEMGRAVVPRLTFSGLPLVEADLEQLSSLMEPASGVFSVADTVLVLEAFLLLTSTVDKLLEEYQIRADILKVSEKDETLTREQVCEEVLRIVGDNDLWGALPVDD
jgi:hypothetical protein